jgi:pimeloyl-ACP methyl ester carboxylesterase
MERIEIEQGLASLVCNVEGPASSIVLLHAGVVDRRGWAGSYMHELTRIMAERLPRARSMTVPGLAHLPQTEQPELIAGLIADFGPSLDRG